jgi:hypothetical protein
MACDDHLVGGDRHVGGDRLGGGNAGGAIRRGDTVRRAAGRWTPAVRALLDRGLRDGRGHD